jgi:hypothetical protein
MKLETQATLVSSRGPGISWAAIFALVERAVNSKENEVKLMASNPQPPLPHSLRSGAAQIVDNSPGSSVFRRNQPIFMLTSLNRLLSHI